MKRSFIAVGMMAFAFVGAGPARGAASPSSDADHYSRAELKQLARQAHTPEQYRNLSSSYATQQVYFLQKAAEAKAEWLRLSENTVSMNAKYPRPVDSARNRYEHYVCKASEAGAISEKYDQMADASAR